MKAKRDVRFYRAAEIRSMRCAHARIRSGSNKFEP